MRNSPKVTSDITHKPKRPKWTRHDNGKWQNLAMKMRLISRRNLTIKKVFNLDDMLLDETQRVLWYHVLVKICHMAGWKNKKGEE